MIINTLWNTSPAILHCPGRTMTNTGFTWDYLREKALKLPPQSGSMENISLLTWHNRPTSVVESSLERFGIKPIVVGKHIKTWNNLFKIDLIRQAFKEIDTQYTIGVDSDDVVFINHPEIVLKTFLSFPYKLVFNATPANWPPIERYSKKEKEIIGEQYFQHLNAGVWVGETEFCRYFFDRVASLVGRIDCDWANFSEQLYVREAFFRDSNFIGIDFKCQICQVVKSQFKHTFRETSLNGTYL